MNISSIAAFRLSEPDAVALRHPTTFLAGFDSGLVCLVSLMHEPFF